ncbi:MAG: nitric oxide reductase activation protein NorD [Tepidimonas sp.]|uniref:nitric oxide reductase activation protein NorD n=1 Tax=Tepidimonas sp. TaxID=2002775 RepID=UPI004055278F
MTARAVWGNNEWCNMLAPASRQRLEHRWTDAARVLSAHGLDQYAKGAAALQRLGRGEGVVDAWIDAVPDVAREIGEDVIAELATTALTLASKTSGAVIELVIATAPTAARRLADASLFLQYLRFLHVLAAQAPRGLRPMLEHLDALLGQLTLGGLRRWALWGAQAFRTQFDEQIAYFGLQSKVSLSVLQQERKGTLLVDVQRRLQAYLRALWGRDFYLKPTAGDHENRQGLRPFIEDYFIQLPDAVDAVEVPSGTIDGLKLYRAAAAHAAAHVVFTQRPMSAQALNPWQMALIGLVEDARVETLAMARFAGLRALWAPMHTAQPTHADSAAHWMARLARAWIDPGYEDTHPWIEQGRALWRAAQEHILAQPEDNTVSWDIGVQLAHSYASLAQGPAYRPRQDELPVAYRDDNRYFWAFTGFDAERAIAAGYQPPRQVRKYVNVMEFVNETDVETAGDDAQEIWVLGTELFPYEDDGISYNQREGREPVAPPVHYPEWDHLIQLERPDWVTVQERRARLGDATLVDSITAEHRQVVSRMKYLLDAMRPQGVQRVRKLEDGDEIDLNAALSALTDLRMGRQPDARVMMRSVRKTRDLSVLLLLDLSQSTNDPVAGQSHTVLALTRAACALLADAIQKVGDPLAIHGFCSDGRHDVRYWRFKDFDQPYDETVKARLAAMTGELSTRMGAAIRHATAYLKARRSAKKLLLVLTDGEPADIDVRDPSYLRHDAHKAVEAAARSGIQTFCLSLDPRADAYVSRIFGVNRYRVLDHVERLPQALPMLYAALTR